MPKGEKTFGRVTTPSAWSLCPPGIIPACWPLQREDVLDPRSPTQDLWLRNPSSLDNTTAVEGGPRNPDPANYPKDAMSERESKK